MTKKIDIAQKTKVCLKWRVLPIDYSHEEEANIAVKFANKYGIPKENVTIEPIFVKMSSDGKEVELTTEAIHNIQDPAFQQQLFKEFIKERKIENIDFDKIVEIDKQINANINYDLYEKNKKYSIKWMKWSNFMSYGPDNYVDFSNFKGLIHLSSIPANQGGKTTFCLDLLRFLLFGKVTSRENGWTLDKAFNKYIPEATEMIVEGCLVIDSTEYVIKRILSRPTLKKRTEKSKVTQKIEYYKVVNGEYIELADTENQEGSTNTETNQIIKESLGNERDFDLMICVSSDNLKELISLKDTDRGRLISRWIGLLPLEEKDKLARDTFNKSIYPKLLLNRYNREELGPEIEQFRKENEDFTKKIKESTKQAKASEKKIEKFKETRDSLLQSKQKIDDELLKNDVTTLEYKRDKLVEEGKRKRAERNANAESLKTIGEIDFNENIYNDLISDDKNKSIELNSLRNECYRLQNEIKDLEKGEYCPTCGAKLKNVDNSALINGKKDDLEKKIKAGEALKKEVEAIDEKITNMNVQRQLFNKKNSLELLIAKNDVDLESLTSSYKEIVRLLKDIEANKAAIKANNEIDIAINNTTVNIKTEEDILRRLNDEITDCQHNIKSNEKTITEYEKIVEQIKAEEQLVRNWKVYVEMVGKNGIGKMLLRNVLPLINGKLKHLLTDVCDFDVEIVIDDHNDIAFHIIHDGVVSNLGSGSGFEQTVASLALRTVLSEISSFSKPSFVVFDEILGGVADENYDNVKNLYDKILADYAFVFQITHLKTISDWANQSLIVKKVGNISKIEMA